MIQSGDGDWIINSHPLGIVVRGTFHGHRTPEYACSGWKDGFLFDGLSPPNKKTYPLCALGDSAVKILFWTRMIKDRTQDIGSEEVNDNRKDRAEPFLKRKPRHHGGLNICHRCGFLPEVKHPMILIGIHHFDQK